MMHCGIVRPKLSRILLPSSSISCPISSSFLSLNDVSRGSLLVGVSSQFQHYDDLHLKTFCRTKVMGGPGERVLGGHRSTEWNFRQIRPAMKEPNPELKSKVPTVEFTKYPGVVSKLGANYYFRDNQQGDSQRYYRMKTDKGMDTVFVGSVDEHKRQTRTIENCLYENTRGFGIQVLFEGRGVKIGYEKKWPHLMGRMGVGDKHRNLSNFCKLDREVRIDVNKTGNIAAVIGPTRHQVANIAHRMYWKLKQGVYTGKGAKIAFNKTKRKPITKR